MWLWLSWFVELFEFSKLLLCELLFVRFSWSFFTFWALEKKLNFILYQTWHLWKFQIEITSTHGLVGARSCVPCVGKTIRSYFSAFSQASLSVLVEKKLLFQLSSLFASQLCFQRKWFFFSCHVDVCCLHYHCLLAKKSLRNQYCWKRLELL